MGSLLLTSAQVAVLSDALPAGAQTMRFFYLTPLWCIMCVCEPTSILTTAYCLRPAS